MVKREIVHIDEEKCDGCGQCVPSCEEGAIRIVDGKARLLSEVYCDGLGACLGHCPQGAISMIEREADGFDEAAVQRHLASLRPEASRPPAGGGCPGAAVQDLGLHVLGPTAPHSRLAAIQKSVSEDDGDRASALRHWPIQLSLVPPGAPFLAGADLLLVAQCVPFAMADFHQRFLQNRAVAIACPKLDDSQAHLQKLVAVLDASPVKSLRVVHMEVPCCTGLVRIARAALAETGKDIPLGDVTISVRGEVLDEV